jgi:hypothetical protein
MNSDCRRSFRIFIPFVILAFIAAVTFVVQALWNGVLVDVVAVKTITYWQALGLLLLARILVGGWPGKGGGRCGPGWRARMMAKKWESLDPAQREKMREEMRRRFGDWPRPSWCDDDDHNQERDPPAKPSTGPA